mmetsp:Transcript_37277/g.72263  ORF Transcript_37277/g.72263 Transcript_37277/m.72263 type:complete len:126 (+) Transcript_37277:1200-1577(+)
MSQMRQDLQTPQQDAPPQKDSHRRKTLSMPRMLKKISAALSPSRPLANSHEEEAAAPTFKHRAKIEGVLSRTKEQESEGFKEQQLFVENQVSLGIYEVIMSSSQRNVTKCRFERVGTKITSSRST